MVMASLIAAFRGAVIVTTSLAASPSTLATATWSSPDDAGTAVRETNGSARTRIVLPLLPRSSALFTSVRHASVIELAPSADAIAALLLRNPSPPGVTCWALALAGRKRD